MSSVFRGISKRQYDVCLTNNGNALQKSCKDSLDFVQRLQLVQKLPVHTGCVNTLSWNDTGELLLSGSDDRHLAITQLSTHKLLSSFQTKHRSNIFSAKFLPNSSDRSVVSCSGDGLVVYSADLEREDETHENCFTCHVGTAYKVLTVPNGGHTFLTCGEDGTVRFFDLRVKTSCLLEECKENVLIDCGKSVTAIAINPFVPYQVAVGCCDGFVSVFDCRMIRSPHLSGAAGFQSQFTVPGLADRFHRITSLTYSANGEELLTSYSSEYLYLFHLKGDCNANSLSTRETDNAGNGECSSNNLRNSLALPRLTKKLRLRGDWSDTGPNARPEREMNSSDSEQVQQQQPHLIRDNLMRHMSDMLTNWMLNHPSNAQMLTNQSESGATINETEVPLNPDDASHLSLASNVPSADFVTEDESNRIENTAARKRPNSSLDQLAGSSDMNMYPDMCTANELNQNSEQVPSEESKVEGVNAKLEPSCQSNVDVNDASSVNNSDSIENLAKKDEIPRERPTEPTVLHKYVGHRNARTMIKEANFWGDDHIMSGSDCGHVFIWNRHTCKLVMTLEADKHVVNCIQPHPFDPILATSGIDYDVKLWVPTGAEPNFDEKKASQIMSRNKVMLEETCDTITVPASFMIRMLASSITNIRQGGIVARWRQQVHRNRSNNNQE